MLFIKSIYWFFQRGFRGWADCDAWEAKDYLARVIPGLVRKIANDSIGCPGDLYDKEKVNDECHRWKEILETVAQGFEASSLSNRSALQKWEEVEENERTYHRLVLDTKASERTYEKSQKGLELFAKYYWNLWD